MNEIERLARLGVASLMHRPDLREPCWVVHLGYRNTPYWFSAKTVNGALRKAENHRKRAA